MADGTQMTHRRTKAFAEAVTRAGAELITPHRWTDSGGSWGAFLDWIAKLPEATGVYLTLDSHAQSLLQELWQAGRSVPEEIAVIGSGNDTLICESIRPQLTSVEIGAERVGYEAACLLERLLAGEKPPDGPILIEPMGVVERASTDILAFEDPMLTRALAYLRQHACQNISVPDILRQVPVTRRWLERRFREVLGTTPNKEINRVRLQRARDLLARTDLPLVRIAEICGYGHARSFGDAFKAATGQPPGAFRTSAR
jgi:LacI family transcriptional regulator